MSNATNPPPTLQQVCDRALRLPCSPALLPRLISVISAPDSSAEEIAQLIMVDPSLAGSTLRLANSAYFGAGAKVASVADAVFRLGQKELFRLASLALVSRWESGVEGRGGPGDFCRHAFCTGLAAEALAEMTHQVEPETAYTAGLVCDLGKLAIGHACTAFLPALYARCADGTCTWLQAERELLGYTHLEIGARLLRVWNFPSALVAAAEYCERPSQGPAEYQPLLAHLHAAKFVAISFGPGVPEEGFLFELDTAFLTERGFTETMLQESMATLHDRAKARLQDKLSHGALAV
ncbi:MAG: HDOD domain-containing protein [Verrucomicrobia bacterium]|nr:HDOD domain-containing protein [Verrucomicrobiota bacterium]